MYKEQGGIFLTKEYFFEKQSVKTWCIAFSLIFFLGIIIGAIYCACASGDSAQGLYQYLTSFINGFQADCMRVFVSTLKKNMFLLIILFLCGFFKAGIAVQTMSVGIKGFGMGFTIAALVKYYGGKGILLAISDLPSMLLFIPMLLLFCAFSMKYAWTLKTDKRKKFVYIGLAMCTMAIFCVSAFAEGYLNTIFMNFLIHRLL